MRALWLIATLILLVSGCDDAAVDTGLDSDTGADTGVDTDTGIDTDTDTDTDTDPDTDFDSDTEIGIPVDLDADGFASVADGGMDCDDGDPSVNPGADELCNGLDDDCDGDVDEDAVDVLVWFADTDDDGFGDPEAALPTCGIPEGHVDNDRDCDDTSAAVHPGVPEVCNGIDDDCDGGVDKDAVDARVWYADLDRDGFGTPWATRTACSAPAPYTDNDTDCDDTDDEVNPGADEVCNGVDDDCNTVVDDDPVDGTPVYRDSDGDGYGDFFSRKLVCAVPSGWVTDGTDLDDTDATIVGGGTEICDGKDNDGNGVIDWGLRVPTDYSTIQAAINAASDGEVVCIAAGTYKENLDLKTVEVTLHGVSGSAVTIIDGGGKASVVMVTGKQTADTALEGLTLTGGQAKEGAGLYVKDSYVALDDVVLDGNSCGASSCAGVGAWVSTAPSALTWEDVSFEAISCESGACSGTGLYVTGTDLTVDGLTVSGVTNSADTCSPTLRGGFAHVTGGSDLVLKNGTIDDVLIEMAAPTSSCSTRHLVGYGGVVQADAKTSLKLDTIEISNVDYTVTTSGTSSGITSYVRGGVIDATAVGVQLDDVTVKDIDISLPEVTSTPTVQMKAHGLVAHAKSFTIDGLTLQDLTFDFHDGSSLMVTEPSGLSKVTDFTVDTVSLESTKYVQGGVWRAVESPLLMSDATFTGVSITTAATITGGLIWSSNSGTVKVTDSVFEDNSVEGGLQVSGGMIEVGYYDSTTLDGVDFFDNTIVGPDVVGGIFAQQDTDGLSDVFTHVDIRGTTVTATDNVFGGIIHERSGAKFTNLIIAGSSISSTNDMRGGLVDLYSTAWVTVTNASLTGTTLSTGSTKKISGGAFAVDYDATLTLVNTDVSDLTASSGTMSGGVADVVFGGRWSATTCNYYNVSPAFSGTASSTGFINKAPGYTSTSGASTAWTLTLTSGSDLVDAGDSTLKDADGTRSDIGAYGGPGSTGW